MFLKFQKFKVLYNIQMVCNTHDIQKKGYNLMIKEK
jgi:hypothetical protein